MRRILVDILFRHINIGCIANLQIETQRIPGAKIAIIIIEKLASVGDGYTKGSHASQKSFCLRVGHEKLEVLQVVAPTRKETLQHRHAIDRLEDFNLYIPYHGYSAIVLERMINRPALHDAVAHHLVSKADNFPGTNLQFFHPFLEHIIDFSPCDQADLTNAASAVKLCKLFVIHKFKQYADVVIQELVQVLTRIDDASVETALSMIEASKRIVLLSGGREGLALKFFAMRLMHLGKDAHWATSDTCPALRPGDLFICVGGAGGESFVLYTEKSVKQTGARILAVTANPESEMARLADGVLVIPAQAFRCGHAAVTTHQTMGNLFEQSEVLVFDILTALLRDRMGQTDAEMEKRHRNFEE